MAGIIDLGIEIAKLDTSSLEKLSKHLEKIENQTKSLSESDAKTLIKQFDTTTNSVKELSKATEKQDQIMKTVASNSKKSAKESARIFMNGKQQQEEAKNIQVQLLEVEKQLYFSKKKNLNETTILLNKYQSKLVSGFELNKLELKMLDKTKAIETDTYQQKEKFVKKISSEKEKANIKDYNNQSKLMRLEVKLSKNGLTDQYGEQLKHYKNLKNIRKEDIRDFEHMIDTQISKTTESKAKGGFGDNLLMSGAQLLTFTKMLQVIKNITAEMRELDRVVFNMGVVAGRSVPEIREMRSEVLALSSDVSISATEIAKASDTVQRTGKSYEESMLLVKAGMKAAIASGEDLQSIIQIANKAMLGFKINADEANEVFEMFHSTVLNSPLDFQKLGAAMGQSASIFGLFIESTSKSGDELKEYKKELLGVNSVLVAIQAEQGRAAGSSGVTVRMALSKMLAMEKTAEKLFNAEAKANNIMLGHSRLTADNFSKLAQEDLPEAINLLSNLYTNGELSYKTLSKVFTVRHAPYVLQSLLEINGNLDEYRKKITTGRNVTEDYEKQMQSWDNTLKKTKNNLNEFLNTGQKFLDKWGVPALNFFNKLLDVFDSLASSKTANFIAELGILSVVGFKGLQGIGNVVKGMSGGFATLKGGIDLSTKSAKTFLEATKGSSIFAKASLVSWGGIGIAVAVAAAAAMIFYREIGKATEDSLRMADMYNKQSEAMQKQLETMKKLRKETKNIYTTIANITQTEFFTNDELIIMPNITSELKKIEDTFKKINFDRIFQQTDELELELGVDFDLDKVSIKVAKMIQELPLTMSSEARTLKIDELIGLDASSNLVSFTDDTVDSLEKLKKSIFEFGTAGTKDIDKFRDIMKSFNLSMSETDKNFLNMYEAMSKTKDIRQAREELKNFEKDSNKFKDTIIKISDIKIRMPAFNVIGAESIKEQLKSFEVTDEAKEFEKFLKDTIENLKSVGVNVSHIDLNDLGESYIKIRNILNDDSFYGSITQSYQDARIQYESSIKDSAQFFKEQADNIVRWADSVENYLVGVNTNIRKTILQKSEFDSLDQLEDTFAGTDLQDTVKYAEKLLGNMNETAKMAVFTSNEFWKWGAIHKNLASIQSQSAKYAKESNMTYEDATKYIAQQGDRLKNVRAEMLKNTTLSRLSNEAIEKEAKTLGVTADILEKYIYATHVLINEETGKTIEDHDKILVLLNKQKDALYQIFKYNESYAQKVAELQMKELEGLDLIKAKREEILRSGEKSQENLGKDFKNLTTTIRAAFKGKEGEFDLIRMFAIPKTKEGLEELEGYIEKVQKRYKSSDIYTEGEEKAIKNAITLRDMLVNILEDELNTKGKLKDNEKETVKYTQKLIDRTKKLGEEFNKIFKKSSDASPYENMRNTLDTLKGLGIEGKSFDDITESTKIKYKELLKEVEELHKKRAEEAKTEIGITEETKKQIKIKEDELKAQEDIKGLIEDRLKYQSEITKEIEKAFSNLDKTTKSFDKLEEKFKSITEKASFKSTREQLDEVLKQLNGLGYAGKNIEEINKSIADKYKSINSEIKTLKTKKKEILDIDKQIKQIEKDKRVIQDKESEYYKKINKELKDLYEKKGNINESDISIINARLKGLDAERQGMKDVNELNEKGNKFRKMNNDEIKKTLSMIGDIFTIMSKGETLKFDSGQAIGGAFDTLGNVFTGELEGGVLHTEDYMSLVSGAMGIMDNVMQQQIQGQIDQLTWENKILDIKKNSAKTEEESEKYGRQALENQKKMIELQFQQQNAFMGVEGVAGSALGGASQGAMTGFMFGGPAGAAIGGALGGLSGLFGGSSAKKQAEEAKRQAEFLYNLNQLIEQQNDILKYSKGLLSEISSSLKFGSQNALKIAFEKVEYPEAEMQVSMGEVTDEQLNYMFEVPSVQYIYPEGIPSGVNVCPTIDSEARDEVMEEIRSTLARAEWALSIEPELSWNESDYENQIQSLQNQKEELMSLYDIADKEGKEYLDSMISLTDEQIAQLTNLKNLISEIGSIYGLTHIGFTLEVKDDGSFEVIWEGRTDYLEGLINGTVDLAEMTAQSIGTLINSVLVDSNNAIEQSLNNLEGFWKIASKELAETGKISKSTMSKIIAETDKLAKEQEVIAKQIWSIKDAYVEAGGSAEDFYNAYNIDLETNDFWRELMNLGLYGSKGAKGIQEINNLLAIQRKEVQALTTDNQSAMDAWLAGDIKGTWDEVKFMFDDVAVELVESLNEAVGSGNLSVLYDTFYENISKGIQDGISEMSMINLGDYIQGQSDAVLRLIGIGDIDRAVELTNQMNKFNNVSEMSKEEIHAMVEGMDYLNWEEKLLLERSLLYQKAVEESNAELEETLTLTERIANSTSKISDSFEEYLTHLYDGSFEAKSFVDTYKEIIELSEMKLDYEKLSVVAWVDLCKLGAINADILAKMPQSIQDTVGLLSNYDYHLGVGNDELQLADQLWNAQVGHIRDNIKAHYIQARYVADINKIHEIGLKIQEAITNESTKQTRIDQVKYKQSIAYQEYLNALRSSDTEDNGYWETQIIAYENEIRSIEAEPKMNWQGFSDELDLVVSDLADKIKNDPTLQNIDLWFGDRTIESMNDVKDVVEELGAEFKSIFQFLSDANNELKETMDFWYEGGKMLVDGEIVGDYKTSVEDINKAYEKQEDITKSISKNTEELRDVWTSGELKVPLEELTDYLDEIDQAIFNLYNGSNKFSDFGKQIVDSLLKGVEDSLSNFLPNMILQYSENLKDMYIDPSVQFDDNFIKDMEIILGLGEEFSELTINDISNKYKIKELLKGIGYSESDITDELINQTQKYLGINLALENNNDSAKEFTNELFKQEQILKGINEYEDELGRLLDQFNMDDQAIAIDDITRGIKELERLGNIDVSLGDILNLDISKIQANVKTSRDLIFSLFPEVQEGLDFTIDIDTQQVEFLGTEAETRSELYEKEVAEQEKSEQIIQDVLSKSKELNDVQEDINEKTETYKTIFEQLSEQQSEFNKSLEFWFRGGQRLLDDKVVGSYSKSISEVNKEFTKMVDIQNQINEDSETLMELWESGELKADVEDIAGYFTQIGQTVYDSLTSALESDNFIDIAAQLGSDISSELAKSFDQKLINEKFKNELVEITDLTSQALASGSLQDFNSLSRATQSLAAKVDYENAKQDALLDILDYNSEVNYATQNTQVQYSTGSTQSVVNNYNITSTVTTGALVTDSFNGVQQVTDSLATSMIESFKKLNVNID